MAKACSFDLHQYLVIAGWVENQFFNNQRLGVAIRTLSADSLEDGCADFH
jgi:hypothetical protein